MPAPTPNTLQLNNNVPLFRQVVALYLKKATLLGYPNYTSLAIETSFLKDLEAVQNLLIKFKDRVSHTNRAELLI
jgi:Zn-dependent oligopeptidase